MTQPTPSIQDRYPYSAPSGDAPHTIKGNAVDRRAAMARGEIDAASKRHAQLLDKQKALLRDFSQGDDSRVRDIGRQIKAAEDDLATLQKRLAVAGELDAEEGVSDATSELDRHIAVALKHLAGCAPYAERLEAGFKLVQESLEGYQACNDAAKRQIHEASRQLPKKRRMDLVHAVNQTISGAENIHALMAAMLASGVGKTGIVAGILLDVHGQMPHETFTSALEKRNNRLSALLGRWRSLAVNEHPPAPPEEAIEPAPPPEPQQVKWADVEPLSTTSARQRAAEGR
jgi:hypothetical protein